MDPSVTYVEPELSRNHFVIREYSIAIAQILPFLIFL
ncbi:hypothetical protein NMY3_02116 [Candidatus Nitrosocosmicus oleophilus]|uniref:Uncharacterized protein n=1 Tax=Candidatus Nitrosocosmicus oleophilus TaxID=1353260 RepID=A0A654LZ99_9ARCH|nr:hypothetical protein NMY3_02116 [Candidatus Nitrosocosmicus oleophilus]